MHSYAQGARILLRHNSQEYVDHLGPTNEAIDQYAVASVYACSAARARTDRSTTQLWPRWAT